MYRSIATILICFICSSAKANEASKPPIKDQRLYILKKPTGLVEINKTSKSKAASEDEAVVMRDPNLAGQPQNKKVTQTKEIPLKAKKAPVKKISSLKYRPVKVAAAVRMPRVEFALPVLPIGIKEESVNVNFIERSLEEAP